MTPTDFKAARKQLGLTQASLGDALGLTRRQVLNLEKGKTPIRTAYAGWIAFALSVQSAPGATGHEPKE